MKKKLSFRELTAVGSMLFGLFFGAGNLIFPAAMGQLAGGTYSSPPPAFASPAWVFPCWAWRPLASAAAADWPSLAAGLENDTAFSSPALFI